MRFEDLWLRYRRRAPWALRSVDLTLAPGQAAVVHGRNGAGKSTLLQVAAGVLRPSRGGVRDRPRVVGWVPERFPANQPFTARAYLRRMAAVRGVPNADAAIGAWAERLCLGAYLDEKLPALSKGSAQKVGLAQALLVPPGLLVLDEPWEGLDAQTRDEIPTIVATLLTDGCRVLVSDHRGETARLPGAAVWHVDAGEVSVAGVSAVGWQPARRWIVEVAVTAADPTAATASLRGHDILGVREG